jgi:putative serine protease PepD
VWPLVAALALIVGTVSGVLGGIGYSKWNDDDKPATQPELVSVDDLDGVNTQPPLDKPGSVARVAEEVLPSTVQIIAEFEGVEAGATGSGFVLDDEGHIVTNNHVVADAAENDGPIEVVDQDGNRRSATVVGRSPVYDLAVLHVANSEGLKPASLGRSRTLRVGEPVVAIGAPLGLSSTVTSGIVSALNRPVTTGSTADDSSYINAIQTDAAINPGNSGGPLVDLQGQVVGVNSAIATNGGGSFDEEAGNIGVGFAIPVEQVVTTADQILETGEAQYPVIGARVQTGGPAEFDGATVDEVLADSPAKEAGLKNGDLITHVNGIRITDGIGLIVAIRTHQPGETIEFTVERDGVEETITVTLDGEVG